MALVASPETTTIRRGNFQTGQFNIATNRHTYDVLSNKLYGNNVRAVIRELSTNAKDSHIAAGTTKPFDVHLPTVWESYFTIRDYGTGLGILVYSQNPFKHPGAIQIFEGSYAEVKDFLQTNENGWTIENVFLLDETISMYTTYFYSSKIDSNDYIGQLGLGSKSPFAYTDSFKVTVYNNGEKRHYQCMIGDEGVPEIQEVVDMRSVTTEPNGLEITFPTLDGDYFKFQREANYVYEYFDDIGPNINISDWTKPERNYYFNKENWGIRSDSGHHATIIMGSIAYPINSKEIAKYSESTDVVNLLSTPIELRMPIGSCEIQPSREHLSYRKSTCLAIISVLKQVKKEISQEISTRLNDSQSLWEARCLAYKLFYDNSSELRSLSSLANITRLTWKGNEIKYAAQIHMDMDGVRVIRLSGSSTWTYKKRDHIAVTQSDVTRLTPRSHAKVIISDLDKGGIARVKYQIEEGNFTEAYLVFFDDNAAKKNFLAKTGLRNDDLIKVSSYPKPPSNTTRRNGSGICEEMVFEYHDPNFRSSHYTYRYGRKASQAYKYWKESKVDFSGGGFFVPLNRYSVCTAGGKEHPENFGTITSNLKDIFQLKIEPLVGVRPAVVKRFQKDIHWFNLVEMAQDYLSKYWTKHNIGRHLANVNELKKVPKGLIQIVSHFVCLCPTSPFAKFAKQIQEMLDSTQYIKNELIFEQLSRYFDVPIPTVPPDHKLDDLSGLLEHYPMVKHIIDRLSRYHETDDGLCFSMCEHINLQDRYGNFNSSIIGESDDSYF